MEIKELMKKLAKNKEFAAIKDAAGLDAFLSGQGIELTTEEKAKTLEYLRSGKPALSDDELRNVSGGRRGESGSGSGKIVPNCAECGSENVTVQHFGSSTVLKCHSCGVTIDPDGIFPAVG